MLAPNKQNLIILKNQLKSMQNGYKLLKEKRAGLIITFLKFAKEGQQLEKEVNQGLSNSLNYFASSTSFVDNNSLANYLDSQPSTHLIINQKRISGVYIDRLNLITQSPQRTGLKKDIQTSFDNFANQFPKLIELSQLKINVNKLSKEIQKTNRQISNIENKIEETKEGIKYIKNALMEKENLEKSILMKIFA